MDWPAQEYYKLIPSDVLLDVSSLTPVQRGAWMTIWLWMLRQHPPGLMQPLDLAKLQEWADLRNADWEKHKIAILGKFVFHAPTASLHDVKIQRNYTDFAQLIFRKRAGGKASAERRNNRKIGKSTPAETPETPFQQFSSGFMQIREDTWEEIIEILAKNGGNRRVLEDSSKSVGRVLSTTTTTSGSSRYAACAAAAPGGETGAGGVAGGMGGDDGDVAAFLAKHTDVELAAIQLRALAASPQFHQAHYRDKSPRQVPDLANLLFNFVTANPTAAAAIVPAAAEVVA